MAVDIYVELDALRTALTKAQSDLASMGARLAKLESHPAPSPGVPTIQVAPVSYFRPEKLLPNGTLAWDSIMAHKTGLAMINPGSGPGLSASTSYTALVPRVQAAGVPVFGYVHSKGPATATNPSGYGERPIADVKADIDKHIAWYGVAGIFIDCTSNRLDHVTYYADLCAHVHGKGRKVILNPGTQCLEDHARMADFVMCSEGYVPTYRARVARPWEANYPGKLWHCVHSCTAADMPSVVALAKSRGAGLVYVTDRLMPNPYADLPSYWEALCTEVGRAA
jgi:hypothetical protein